MKPIPASDPLVQTGTMGRIILSAIVRFTDRPAIADDEKSWTYRELGVQIGRAMAVLEQLGAAAGDGIAILSANRAELVAVEFAAMLMGLRYTALHPLAARDTHVFILGDAAVKFLLVDPGVLRYDLSDLPASLTSLRGILAFGPVRGAVDIVALMQSAAPAALEDRARPEDLVRLLYTGGTTGTPKGVQLPHRSMLMTTLLQATEWDLPAGPLRFLAATPISHASGAVVPTVLMQGGFVRLTDGFSPESFCRIVSSERINLTFLVPTMIYVLLDYPPLRDHDLHCLETIVYGAAPMSVDRLRKAMEMFGPVFVQLYGQTEAPMCISTLRKADHDPSRPERLSSCGLPTPLMQVKLFDSDMREVADGAPGEICVRGPLMMSGYWNRPEATAEVFRGDWLHTGDVATRAADGYLTIVDRTRDMIISGGFNIYPSEVEHALLSHPDVALAAVIGVPDAKWGEAVTAFVVLRAGAAGDAAALKAHVKDRRGSVWAPKHLLFTETMPLTALGKVDRNALRKMMDEVV